MKLVPTLLFDCRVVVLEVPVVASCNTIVPAVEPVGVPIVSVWFPKSGLILVPAMAAAAFTSASTMVPSRILEEVTAPVPMSVAPCVPETSPARFPVKLVAVPLVISDSNAKVPVVAGNVRVGVPATAGTVNVAVPLVVPFRLIAPVVTPVVPTVMVEAKVGAVPKTANPVPVSSLSAPANPAELLRTFCFPLKVDQSVELKAPLFVAEAVGTFKVITGVEEPFATEEAKSVPVVPKVKAATDVTVPPVPEALRVVPDRLSPLPREISCTGVVVDELPNSLLVAERACIFP